MHLDRLSGPNGPSRGTNTDAASRSKQDAKPKSVSSDPLGTTDRVDISSSGRELPRLVGFLKQMQQDSAERVERIRTRMERGELDSRAAFERAAQELLRGDSLSQEA